MVGYVYPRDERNRFYFAILRCRRGRMIDTEKLFYADIDPEMEGG